MLGCGVLLASLPLFDIALRCLAFFFLFFFFIDPATTEIYTLSLHDALPIRRYAEDWSLDTMLKNVETSVSALVKERLPVMFVTEDTTRADPETLVKLYETAIGAGATRICFSDTVGHATPDGVRNLLAFARDEVVRGRAVKIDYHGHT